ncbi:hypothetical protein, partial [Mycobacterium avium]|uniref:hypothetical protein n=1 Tax=Mycobacterium avium TaxID=1764 RepID=UPI001CDA64D3
CVGTPNEEACPAVFSDAHTLDASGSTGTGRYPLSVDYQLSGKSLKGRSARVSGECTAAPSDFVQRRRPV